MRTCTDSLAGTPFGVTLRRARVVHGLTAFALVCLCVAPALAQLPARPTQWPVIKSQHRRLMLPGDIQRVAVGDETIASVEVVTNREILVLGREMGRTTLIIWFASGAVTEGLIIVQRDLSVLQDALRRVHPSIDVESAPDRDAIILSGRVPDFALAQQAEAVASRYLQAGGRSTGDRTIVVLPSGAAAPGGLPAAPAPDTPPPGTAAAASSPAARLQVAVPPSGSVINLIQVDRLPMLPEDRIRDAIRWIGGGQVTVRRVMQGNLRDDERDTLVLEGRVPNQIALVRALQLAAQIFTNATLDDENLRVLADEGGGLTSRTQAGQQQQQGGGGTFGARGGAGLFGGGGGGGGGGARLGNQVRTNIGRASVVSAANGRILSFVEVMDLPQIRVNIRVFEVNREKLRSFTPVTAAIGNTLRLPSADPSEGAVTAQGRGTSTASGSAVQNVLGFLAGGFLNEAQFTSSHLAVVQALTLLEREGIARTLSTPSLTVLSGESARFQVGGEVPIPIAFSPAIGGADGGTPGVFTAVDFVSFGIQLEIRPLVGEDDTITLDVQPQVITPDAALTASIRDTTGREQTTTAFSTRALRTSARLPDGQALLLGGLTTQNSTLNTAKTPGLGDTPGLGWLFKSFNRGEDALDLVIVVNPTILRTRIPDAPLWSFPTTADVLRRVAGASSAPHPASPDEANPR